MEWKAKWIKPAWETGSEAPLFARSFRIAKPLTAAVLRMTGLGVYEAAINGQRVSKDVLAPGWTAYTKRLQVQRYDVTELLAADNTLTVLLGKGWYRSPLMCANVGTLQTELMKLPAGITAELTLTYTDGTEEVILTDESWTASQSQVRFSELYGGEVVDATFTASESSSTVCFDGPTETLISQEGAPIREQERIIPVCLFTTPKGEKVIDFGQELTGFLEVSVDARAGDTADVSFAEVMDQEGSFYTENYRGAKCRYH